MKKALFVALALCVATSIVTAPALAKKKKKKVTRIERVAEARYENPSIGSGPTGGLGLNIPTFPTAAEEVFVSVEVTDDVNPMAGVRVRWDQDADGTSDGAFFVCGVTAEPVSIPGGVTLDVFPYIGGDVSCPGSGAFMGTVTMTFSNLP
jgi:hypothetical protein